MNDTNLDKTKKKFKACIFQPIQNQFMQFCSIEILSMQPGSVLGVSLFSVSTPSKKFMQSGKVHIPIRNIFK